MRVRLTEQPGRLTRAALLCALLSFGYLVLAWNGPIAPPIVGWIPPLAVVLIGVVATGRLVVATPLPDASRRFWRMIAAAVGLIAVGAVSQLVDAVGHPGGPSQVMTLRTTSCFLAGLGLILVALLMVPVNRMTRTAWVTFALDAGTVLAGSALFTWYFALRSAGGFVAATGSTLPLVGTVAAGFLGVLALLKISFAGVRQVDAGALQLLALAALTSASTAGLTPLFAVRPYVNSSLLSFPLAYLFLTAAVERQRRAALAALDASPVAAEPRPGRFRWLYLLPYVAIALTDVLLLHTVQGHRDEQPVILGAVLVTALVAARQLVSFRENGRLVDQLDQTVAELRTSENRLTFQASHDGLTGLANRVLLAERIDAALTSPAAADDVAMALIDLDDFKSVNDRLGHIVGDQLLVAAAARIREAVGEGDTVARLGGDEFAVLFRGVRTDPERPAARVGQILAALAEPLRIDGHELRIRASVGLADGWVAADSNELIRRADVAMYAAKTGAGGWARFVPAMDASAVEAARLAAGLRDGLGRGDFRVVYQPIVTLPEQRIAGVEALVRWHDPERGLIPPDRFIPVAERSGLIVPLGRWVLREACGQAAAWSAVYGGAAPSRVCVNVSPRQLDEPDFVDDVAAALADSGLPAEYLVVEVTETAVFGGGRAVEALHALRALGVRVALDDFGTGHSSLGLLLTCPVDILKVDKSFVDGVTEPGDRAVIVEFLCQVARGLELDTVAEGVEDAAQAARLHELGYRKGQGYLFARPLPAAELADLLLAALAPAAPQALSAAGAAAGTAAPQPALSA
ncbi:putative bifunctional diguanylate cyclase/phosphodiesterase [Cryptosporangium aurantiacum]|uniref:Diguanylate cyclase (GGDEF) domain-containing protein n=1 Tax=Cryptosporangium aurantiacum TaxID=134849 RepID=A0A1M7R6T0_9ACTN|nr:EAL domain-containing protein [Cryptosporangium aurantiacum]SHN41946.1 diguanylate cyclase (GGDEF) domain-containing protein [Cryptosporangium aurantiacum]